MTVARVEFMHVSMGCNGNAPQVVPGGADGGIGRPWVIPPC